MQTFKFIIVFVMCITAPILLLLLTESAVTVHFIWDFANTIGYVASFFILALFVYTGQRRSHQKYSSRFYNNFHRHLGLATLLLVTLHVAILLWFDPVLIEHVKITAPLYMLSGLLAAVLIVILTFSSFQSTRKLIWDKYTSFKFIHGICGIGILLFSAIHIYYSQYYMNSLSKIIILGALTSLITVTYFYFKHSSSRYSNSPLQIKSVTPGLICYGSCFILIGVAFVVNFLINNSQA
jgi:hypothetical protein